MYYCAFICLILTTWTSNGRHQGIIFICLILTTWMCNGRHQGIILNLGRPKLVCKCRVTALALVQQATLMWVIVWLGPNAYFVTAAYIDLPRHPPLRGWHLGVESDTHSLISRQSIMNDLSRILHPQIHSSMTCSGSSLGSWGRRHLGLLEGTLASEFQLITYFLVFTPQLSNFYTLP